MPAWLLPLLEAAAKAALPIIWQGLVKAGVITATEADLLKAGTHVLAVVQNIQTFPEYPGDKPLPPIVTNITTGNPPQQ